MAASFEIRMRNGAVLADVASIAFDKRLKRRLNRPAECSFRVPSYLVNEIQSDGRPLICAGYRQVAVSLDATGLFFHGIIWNVEDDGDEDMIYTQVTAYDPMVVWRYRPARDLIDSYSGDAGNLSDPSFIERKKYGPQIMEEILQASENYAVAATGEAEGQLFLDLGGSTYATGGQDLRGAPTNWPMTIADIATLLTNTGELDIVIEPIIGGTGSTVDGNDPGVFAPENIFQNMGRVHCYNGNHGVDRQGSVHFDYATGDFNARLFRRSEDMTTIGTKIFYFLGPRLDQQHWRQSVTGGAGPPPAVGGLFDLNPEIYNYRQAARAALGVWMPPISIFDSYGNEGSARPLYEYSFLTETVLRAKPRELTYITPVRNGTYGPGDFDIGDLITVNIGSKTRRADTGGQRIYGYTIEIDDDGVESLGEFECSPDQDSI